MSEFEKILCIDGSGAKDQGKADLKRPIYYVDTQKRSVGRADLDGKSAFEYFHQQASELNAGSRMLVAADVVIGLPKEPDWIWSTSDTFVDWLNKVSKRIGPDTWREELIAQSLAERTAERPFSKVKTGTKHEIAFKRLCDNVTNGESVFCIDSGAKQVGRASLQFWFEVLIPLRNAFPGQVAIWPFEPLDNKPIVIAECYPVACQATLKLPVGIKRNAPEVVRAILSLRDRFPKTTIEESTWFHSVSSEDEYDTFTTALAFSESKEMDELLWYPQGIGFESIPSREGWMLGLKETERLKKKSSSSTNRNSSKAPKTSKVPVGSKNRNDQENLGPSGKLGPKGPLVRMKCCVFAADGGVPCEHVYETNPQEVFQKKCPACQGGR